MNDLVVIGDAHIFLLVLINESYFGSYVRCGEIADGIVLESGEGRFARRGTSARLVG